MAAEERYDCPGMIRIVRRPAERAYSPIDPGSDPQASIASLSMFKMRFGAPHKIHGVRCQESPYRLSGDKIADWIWDGYLCDLCSEILPVPDGITDLVSLIEAMQHGCTGARS